MRIGLSPVLLVVLIALCPAPVRSAEWKLGECVVRSADAEQAREVIVRRDAFVERLSPFDRAVRLGSSQPVTEEQLLRHLAAQVRDWKSDEEAKLGQAFAAALPKLRRWSLPWPEEISLVKTTGREEPGAAGYCRGNAVILSAGSLARTPQRLERLLIHELFHVLSNQNRQLRRKLYAVVGFEPCNEIEYPPSLAERRITNPDAPVIEHYTRLSLDERQVPVVPILFSKREGFDESHGKTLFDYLQFRLLVIERHGGRWRPKQDSGAPELLDPAQTPQYLDRIGRNTEYIIHPEEVLAENFVLLVNGRRDVPDPRILKGMVEIFEQRER